MHHFARAGIGAIAAAVMMSWPALAAQAEDALAVGACAAYGYAYDYPSSETAQAAAVEKCGEACKKVVTTEKGCVAFAVDGHKPCGPNGYANASKLGTA